MVSASPTVQLTSAINPVTFDKVWANIGNMWDNNTHMFTMKKTEGIFYVGMDVGVLYKKPLDFVLQKSNQPFASCGHTYNSQLLDDTTGRDIVLRVNSMETLHFSSSTGISGNLFGKSNIGIFNIAELVSGDNGPALFSVASDAITNGAVDPVIFNQILVNDYSQYDVSSGKFTAPSSGIYYFTLSVGAAAQSPVEFMLYVNDVPFTSIIRESTAHAGTDVIGRSIMMYLNEADTVHIVNSEGKVAWSSELLETSFAGFKYDPAYGNKVSKKVMFSI